MTEIKHFEVRPDVVCNHYDGNKSEALANAIATFLLNKEEYKETPVLYNDFLKRNMDINNLVGGLPSKGEVINDLKTGERTELETGDRIRAMAKQLKEWRDINPDSTLNVYYFFNTNPEAEGFLPLPGIGVILNQKINVEQSSDLYRKLFAYIFSKAASPADFLKYHYERTFGSNLGEYKPFLFLVEGDNADMIAPRKKLWDEWIHQAISFNSGNMSEAAKAFKALFKVNTVYDTVIKELSQENRGKIDEDSNKWFDDVGNFVLKGRGLDGKQDHPSYVGALLNVLITIDAIYSEIKKDIPTYAETCFGVKNMGKAAAKGNKKKHDKLHARLRRVLPKTV